jgi:hypothetical protein
MLNGCGSVEAFLAHTSLRPITRVFVGGRISSEPSSSETYLNWEFVSPVVI